MDYYFVNFDLTYTFINNANTFLPYFLILLLKNKAKIVVFVVINLKKRKEKKILNI